MSSVDEKRVLAQFKSEDGVLVGTPFDLPLDVTKDSLAALCNAVLENVSGKYLSIHMSDQSVAKTNTAICAHLNSTSPLSVHIKLTTKCTHLNSN